MARNVSFGILHLHKVIGWLGKIDTWEDLLTFLWQEHIVHRDIAAQNVLVGQNYGASLPSHAFVPYTCVPSIVQRFLCLTLVWLGRN